MNIGYHSNFMDRIIKQEEEPKPQEMTNEEWRRICSTEEFAEWITELSELCTIRHQCELCDGWCDEKKVMEWLKEKHNDL